MDFDKVNENMRRYHALFGELPNSRLMPDEVLVRLDYLIAVALDRGSPLTDEELQLGSIPKGATS